jgi:Cof subfamily protein (haloacid dehalogenase superfamily)
MTTNRPTTFRYKLAAIDLDETLLGPDHQVSERNARAVRSMREAGITCVIASGRMHEATTRYAEQLGLVGPIISYGGAMVRHSGTGEVWQQLAVPAESAAEVVRFCADNGFHLNFYLDDVVWVAERGPWAEFYLRQTGSPMTVVGDLAGFIGKEPTKMILIDTPEKTDELMRYFAERFGPKVALLKTNPEYLEFMNPAASKASALQLVAQRLDIRREETVAFGDGNNDVPMIQWAGLGVAMGSGSPAAIAAADRVAPPFHEDGFGMVVEELLAGR